MTWFGNIAVQSNPGNGRSYGNLTPVQDAGSGAIFLFYRDNSAHVNGNEVDVGKLNKVAVDSVKTASGYNYLIGIPWTMHFHPLYYNKDIFDQFGVTYPKDGITWDT